MRERSWLMLEPDPPELRLADDLRARDPLQGRDCGWVSQMRPFVRAFSRPGDTVLDPFCGLGTTLIAAALEGRHGIGVEIDPDRVALARERLQRHGLVARIESGTLAETTASNRFDLCLTNVPYFGCRQPSGHRAGHLYDAASYDAYLTAMRSVFHAVRERLVDDGFCIAMVQNARVGERMVPQAWDLARILGSLFEPCEERVLLYPARETSETVGAHDPTKTDRSHEFALVFRHRRPRIDIAEARALLDALRDRAFEFEVVGSARHLWPNDAPAQMPPPGDIDLRVPGDGERLRALLLALREHGFRLSLWGEPVNVDVRPETVRDHHYLRAERLLADGRRLWIDLSVADA
ncbi:MAG: DNA methyltransferase [Pseudomonadota bacterium]